MWLKTFAVALAVVTAAAVVVRPAGARPCPRIDNSCILLEPAPDVAGLPVGLLAIRGDTRVVSLVQDPAAVPFCELRVVRCQQAPEARRLVARGGARNKRCRPIPRRLRLEIIQGTNTGDDYYTTVRIRLGRRQLSTSFTATEISCD
jgi:hypothetical protein